VTGDYGTPNASHRMGLFDRNTGAQVRPAAK
jgi:hypothetical protein